MRVMSSRRPPTHATQSIDAERLRSELDSLKYSNQGFDAVGTSASSYGASLQFEQMTATEQAAGSLGVHPDSWKPIQFMNASHYDSLKKNNALDDDLARRIEAFRSVAAQ